MTRSPRMLPIAVAVAAAVLLAACSTTKSPGRQVDDATIKAAVKAKLTADRFSNIVNVEVNVTNGVVTLAGQVSNEQVRLDAEKETLTVEGVVRVNNEIQVKRPSSS
jgi:osmotically-inducible protein OsmY